MIMNSPAHGYPAPPAEAAIVRLAREAQGISPETAAERTPIRLGGMRWRQIERGYERLTPFKDAVAPDRTLAHMAHTVGVSPERLAEVGREGAAEILREILRQEEILRRDEEDAHHPYADLTDEHERAIYEMDDLSEERKRTIIDILRAGREADRRRHA
jgi:hypothetical protein